MIWTILDYGVGNIHSLRRALEQVGCEVQVHEDAKEWINGDVLVLPGVGSFGHVMQKIAPVAAEFRRLIAKGKPVLGICIGMQIAFESSEETPGVPGIGILPGIVTRLSSAVDKVPHMGWNDVVSRGGETGVAYFVHSFCNTKPTASTTMITNYAGAEIVSAAEIDHCVFYQFHPEKSGEWGRQILAEARKKLEAWA